MKNGEETTLT